MRILSPFHDYYDSVQAQGQDRAILFMRKASLVASRVPGMPWDAPLLDHKGLTQGRSGSFRAMGQFKGERIHFSRFSPDAFHVQRAYVLVGGKAHAVWIHTNYLTLASNDGWSQDRHPMSTWVMGQPAWLGDPDLEHMVAAWRTQRIKADPALAQRKLVMQVGHGETLDYPELFETPKPQAVAREMREHDRVHQAVLAHDWTALHLEHETPVLLLKARRPNSSMVDSVPHAQATTWVVRNPRLADLRLGSTLDAFTLFQEISMFIGGVMPGQTAPLLTISDKIQVVKKGFDPVYGFRRRPTKGV